VRGEFAEHHRDEILLIARNVETREKNSHPINRIMNIVEEDKDLVIKTTESHLAQAIGKALHGALSGDLELSYQEDIVRVEWSRDE